MRTKGTNPGRVWFFGRLATSVQFEYVARTLSNIIITWRCSLWSAHHCKYFRIKFWIWPFLAVSVTKQLSNTHATWIQGRHAITFVYDVMKMCAFILGYNRALHIIPAFSSSDHSNGSIFTARISRDNMHLGVLACIAYMVWVGMSFSFEMRNRHGVFWMISTLW